MPLARLFRGIHDQGSVGQRQPFGKLSDDKIEFVFGDFEVSVHNIIRLRFTNCLPSDKEVLQTGTLSIHLRIGVDQLPSDDSTECTTRQDPPGFLGRVPDVRVFRRR